MITFSLILVLVLVQWIVSPVTSDTFHIVSSPSAPCPGEFIGEPCLTLQQYVSNPSISNDNITLLFETGNHTMSSTFTVSNAMKLTMSGSNVVIQCTRSMAYLTLHTHPFKIPFNIFWIHYCYFMKAYNYEFSMAMIKWYKDTLLHSLLSKVLDIYFKYPPVMQ